MICLDRLTFVTKNAHPKLIWLFSYDFGKLSFELNLKFSAHFKIPSFRFSDKGIVVTIVWKISTHSIIILEILLFKYQKVHMFLP